MVVSVQLAGIQDPGNGTTGIELLCWCCWCPSMHGSMLSPVCTNSMCSSVDLITLRNIKVACWTLFMQSVLWLVFPRLVAGLQDESAILLALPAKIYLGFHNNNLWKQLPPVQTKGSRTLIISTFNIHNHLLTLLIGFIIFPGTLRLRIAEHYLIQEVYLLMFVSCAFITIQNFMNKCL